MVVHGFKVRDRNTGLYLCGGVRWTKTGKIWTKLSHLRSAANGLNMVPPWWELVVLTEGGSVNGDIVIKSETGFKEKDVIELLTDYS